jgi:DNA-binding transcriptional LysR family regulator
MELRHLRYFVAVAEELHFGRAAERLRIAQQPLSRQIRDLEEELQVQLFHRTKRTIRLTEAGTVFLADARKVLNQTEQAVQTVQLVSQGDTGRLVVGFTGSALNTVVPQVVRQFKQRYPRVELCLERLSTNEQVKALLLEQIQIGFLHPPIAEQSLILQSIYREALIAVLPEIHPLAKAAPDPISIRELADESFLLFPRPSGPALYDQIISFCQQSGFSPHIVQEVVSQQTILGLVAVGIGVSLIHTSARRLKLDGVVARPLIEPTPQLELAVAWHPDVTNPAAARFLELVGEIL